MLTYGIHHSPTRSGRICCYTDTDGGRRDCNFCATFSKASILFTIDCGSEFGQVNVDDYFCALGTGSNSLVRTSRERSRSWD